MSTSQSVSTETSRSTIAVQLVAGIVLAPVLMFLAGWATATYLTDGMALAGALIALILTAATVVVAAKWKIAGVAAGVVVAAAMLVFLLIGAGPASRPELDLNGMIALGGSGLLTAAVAAASLTAGLIRR